MRPLPDPFDRREDLASRRPRRGARAFTLVELLIVVIILGILAAVIIPAFGDVSLEAKESSVRANLAAIRQAISLYRVQHDEQYPGANGEDWDTIVRQLEEATNADGGFTDPLYGPYLRTGFPENEMEGNAEGLIVATMPAAPVTTNGEGWIYTPVGGEIRANTIGNAPSGIPFFDL